LILSLDWLTKDKYYSSFSVTQYTYI
jgi:hypothetical protein